MLPIVRRAAERHAQGAAEDAERLCLEVLELAPGQLEALTLLYRIRRAGRQQNAADALLRRIVQLHPDKLRATHELILVLFNRGGIAEAEVHARNAARIAPENPQSHNLILAIESAKSARLRCQKLGFVGNGVNCSSCVQHDLSWVCR